MVGFTPSTTIDVLPSLCYRLINNTVQKNLVNWLLDNSEYRSFGSLYQPPSGKSTTLFKYDSPLGMKDIYILN
jgi:hypothetical protein